MSTPRWGRTPSPSVDVARGEKVLASATAADGTVVAGTRDAFYVVALGMAALGSRISSRQALPPILTKSMAAYAALTSYSDTGTAELEGPATVDRSTFTTRAPHRPATAAVVSVDALSATMTSNSWAPCA